MTDKMIIGCDPDSNKSGFAVYDEGHLELFSFSIIEFYKFLEFHKVNYDFMELHIENVKANKAVWHSAKENRAAYGMTCQKVGQCKQVQTELERIAENFGIKVVHHKVSKKWKDSKLGKAALERVFGYSGQSNEDTRSAAYFAHLGSKLN